MSTSTSKEFSYCLYARLLRLYPREFREEYGPSMLQLFTDQCRLTRRERGSRGMVSLWFRTLLDTARGVLREHIASPYSSWGLMEAVPNKPLPWKGVAVVLIPCMVFFVGQLGQLAGQDWFFLLIYRAAYFLIIPVGLVWFLTRKFPIWGLIPLGMFYRTILNRTICESSNWCENSFRRFVNLFTGSSLDTSFTRQIIAFILTHTPEMRILMTAFLLGTAVFLIIRIARRGGFVRSSWTWLGVFLMFTVLETLYGLYYYGIDLRNISSVKFLLLSESVTSILESIAYFAFYGILSTMGFLLLILVGSLLTRRHGRLALLLPLGYLIPSVLLGRFDNSTGFPYSIFWVIVFVFAYRAIVTLVAPIWIVRSASDHAQKRAGAIVLPAALGIIAAAHAASFLFGGSPDSGYKMGLLDYYYYLFSPELLILTGIALAITLYKPVTPAKAITGSTQVAVEMTGD